MFMTCLGTKFHLPNSNVSLDTIIRPNTGENFLHCPQFGILHSVKRTLINVHILSRHVATPNFNT